MHGCMDAWMHGCMDAWMDGCMHACMYVCMYSVYSVYLSIHLIMLIGAKWPKIETLQEVQELPATTSGSAGCELPKQWIIMSSLEIM